MGKQTSAKVAITTTAQYSQVGTSSSAQTAREESSGGQPEVRTKNAAKTVAHKKSARGRVLVLQAPTQVGNPYDIGTEATLAALRRSGVLTANGKLAKTFR